MQSIFERYGGFPVVSRIVSTFYDRMLDDDDLSGYFANTDMRHLIDHQTKFLASVMGGPASYTPEHLARVHERLKIDDAAFEGTVLILRETLEDHGLEETDIATVIGRVREQKSSIVFA